jgi:hypothetical protein
MPIDNRYYEERSPLWSLASASALAGGIGYSYIQGKEDFARALRAGSNDISESIISRAAQVSDFNVGSVMSSNIDEEFLRSNVLSMVGGPGIVKGNLHQAAYESLLATGTITNEEALLSLAEINKQSTPLDAYEAAMSVIRGKGDLDVFGNKIEEMTTAGEARLALLQDAVMPSSRYGVLGPRNVPFSELSATAQERFGSLKTNITEAAGSGFDINWKFRNVEDLIGGRSVTTPMAMLEISGERFAFPLDPSSKVVYGGKNLSTRYMTRQAYTTGGQLMNYADLAEATVVDAIRKSRNQQELKNNLFNAHKGLIENIWESDSAARSAAIWTPPEPVLTSGGRARARLTLKEAVAYNIPEEERIALLGENLYPFTSPNTAGKGTFVTANIREGLFGPLGNLITPEQRPTQFIRSEWGVTEAAKQAASPFRGTFGSAFDRVDRKVQGADYKALLYGTADPRSAKAYSAPQPLTFYARPGDKVGYQREALNNLLSAEEGAISSSARGMFEYEKLLQKKISLTSNLPLNKQLASKLEGVARGTFVPIEGIGAGAFLGTELETGRELALLADDAVAQSVIGAEITEEGQATLFLKERRRMQKNELWKFFSEENKYMLGLADDLKFREIAEAAGAELTIGGQRLEAIQSGKLVGRNQFSLLTQQIEAASVFAGNIIDSDVNNTVRRRIRNQEIQAFLADPAKALNVSGLMANREIDSAYAVQKNLIGLTKGWGFSEQEMQRTFGLMSSGHLEQMVSEGILSPAEQKSILSSSGVIGLGKGRLGDLASGNWGRGSFEQSGFRLLTAKGEEGAAFATELSKRILGKGELGAIAKMEESVLGQESFLKKFSKMTSTPISKIEDLVGETGRYVSLGRKFKAFGGSSRIYVPGTSEASGLLKPIISRGEEISAPLISELRSFQSLLKAGRPEEELESAAERLRNLVVQLSETQSAARGKVVGSEILTGVRRTFKEQSDTFRISQQSADRMFNDLIKRSAVGEKEFLEQQRQALMSGETLMGGMWRHPTTGPESFQFVKYKVDKQLADGMVAAPTKFGTLAFKGGRSYKADISEMVGFAGDFDRDQFVLSAIAEKNTANKVRRNIDTKMRQQYTNYVFNHYGMKDIIDQKVSKSAILDTLSREALQSGYKKLTTAKTTTGQVNLALQKLKIGLQYTAPEEYRPLADLFFHLEQTAIGGKHGVLTSDLYQAIAASTKGGEQGLRTMTDVLTTLFGGDKINLKGQVTDSFGNVTSHAFNMDLKQAAQVAISSYDAVSQDVDIAVRAASMAKGKSSDFVTLNKLTEQFYARRQGSIDIAQQYMQANAENLETLTGKTSRLIRKAEAKSKSLLSAIRAHKKPILIGAAAAVGIAALSPSVSGVLRPVTPVPNKRREITAEHITPEGPPMNPPEPGPNIAPRVYDFGGGDESIRANIRTRINDLQQSENFMDKVKGFGGQSSLRIKDDRSVLDPHLLANKIHERL